MNYRTLFDCPEATAPIARHSDPITSHQAAAEAQLKLKKHKAAVFGILQASGHPMTAQEAAAAVVVRLGGLAETYRKRCHELVNDGFASECGFRPCQITGKNAQTFKAKDGK